MKTHSALNVGVYPPPKTSLITSNPILSTLKKKRFIVTINDTDILWLILRQLFFYGVQSCSCWQCWSRSSETPERDQSNFDNRMLLPPMVKLSICCRSLVATWALAPLIVTKMVTNKGARGHVNMSTVKISL